VLIRLSLSEKPSQFVVELPIRVKVPIHESSHHVSRQRGYLLAITARMDLDTLPIVGVLSSNHGMILYQVIMMPPRGASPLRYYDATVRNLAVEAPVGRWKACDGDHSVGEGLTEILSPTGAPVAELCGDGAVISRFSTGFGPEPHEHLPRTLSDRPDNLVVFTLGEQLQRGRPHVSFRP
jgi:hypothetical protein